MISPYVLRYATTVASAENVRTFLKNCFTVTQKPLPEDRAAALIDADLIWDFEEHNVFPLYIRCTGGKYDLAVDPCAPIGECYDFATFLGNIEDSSILSRIERSVSFSRRFEKTDVAANTLAAISGWLEMHTLQNKNMYTAVLVKKSGLYGVVNAYGKLIAPVIYDAITPLALHTAQIDLLVCRRGDAGHNTVDVYDLNGNKIYEDIGGLYLHTDTVTYTFDPREGNRPTARHAEQLKVVQYVSPEEKYPFPYKEYVRDAYKLTLLPCADTDDGPRRVQRMSTDCPIVRSNEDISLCEVYDIIFPLAEKVGAFYGESGEEVMLSIPHWPFYRLCHQPMAGVTADLPLHLIVDMPECSRAFFEKLGLKTAWDIARADLSKVCKLGQEAEFEIFVSQGQIQYSLEHPEEVE